MTAMNRPQRWSHSKDWSRLSRSVVSLATGIFLAMAGAHAEVQQVNVLGSIKKEAIVAMPTMESLAGWHQDKMRSIDDKANVLVPNDAALSMAVTSIYAKAILKSRNPDIKTLDALIARDRQDFSDHIPGVEIREVPPITTADGKALKSLQYFAAAANDWEQTAYGEDGDYYLVFSVSAHTQAAFESAQKSFLKWIAQYKVSP